MSDILKAIRDLTEALACHKARGPLRIDLDFEAGQVFERQVIDRDVCCIPRRPFRDEHGIYWRALNVGGVEVRLLGSPIPDWQLKKSGYLR